MYIEKSKYPSTFPFVSRLSYINLFGKRNVISRYVLFGGQEITRAYILERIMYAFNLLITLMSLFSQCKQTIADFPGG